MPFLKYLVLLLAPALFSTAVLSYLISDSTSKHADPDTQSCHATDGVGLDPVNHIDQSVSYAVNIGVPLDKTTCSSLQTGLQDNCGKSFGSFSSQDERQGNIQVHFECLSEI